MNVSQFVFFDSTSTSKTSNVFGNSGAASAMTIQVDNIGSSTADFELTVEGAVDMNSPDSFFQIKLISLENLRTVKTITATGIYMVIIDGVARVRLKSTNDVGTFKAYAVSVQ